MLKQTNTQDLCFFVCLVYMQTTIYAQQFADKLSKNSTLRAHFIKGRVDFKQTTITDD